MRTITRWHIIIALIVMLGLGIWQGVPFFTSHSARANVQHTATATTPIQHVVIIMQENHSFDSMFGQFPGANGVILPRASNPLRSDFDHSGPASLAAMDGGKMDELPEQSSVQYTQADIPTYWAYAQQFGLGDNFFSSIASSSLPNHMAMVAAQSGGIDTTVNNQGCGSIQNMLLYSRNTAGNQYWAYPCYSINSLPQLLNANSVSWRYYASVAVWNSPQLIQGIYGSPNDIHNPSQFIHDVQSGNLAAVSWLNPPGGGPSAHPPALIEAGENFVAQQVNAIMNSQYWNSTAIFISFDEWGGLYDHVAPPQVDGTGLGFRVPLIVISPYAKQGYISHAQSEFSSFVKFVEENWGLPNLGQRDSLSSTGDLMDFFDFNQAPQPPLIEPMLNYSQTLLVPTFGDNGAHGGVQAAITPTIGSTSTIFKYYVIYTLSSTPAVHNVTIDGVNHPMTVLGPSQGGAGIIYQYSTKLGLGSHSFSFTFSNVSGAVTLPDNGVPFPGPEAHPFNVGGMSVKPGIALPGAAITFSATYRSPTNTPPALAEVDVDGTPYALQANGTNYLKGVTYTYKTSKLIVGQHYYRFRFDDGSGVAIYEGLEKPLITPIVLSNSSVTPTSGTSSTVFTFQATYSESAGASPVQAMLYVDNAGYPMTYVSGSYSTGALFQVQTTLPAGNHSFAFVFSDSQSSWADPFAPSLYAGPNVGANAQPVEPGTLIIPSHDVNPDVLADPDG